MIRFGAFDAMAPSGLVSVAHRENIFGLRLLTLERHTGTIVAGKTLDWKKLRLGSITADTFELGWEVEGKQARVAWSRVGERSVYGEVSFEDGLDLVAELYVPWEHRLTDRWANFVLQDPLTIAGEMVSPYPQPELGAVRVSFSGVPVASERYNERDFQLLALQTTKSLQRVAPGDIWNDMGVCWFAAVQFDAPFGFLLEVGDPQDFLAVPGAAERERRLEEAAATHREVREAHLVGGLRTGGELGDVGQAVQNLLGFNVLYREDTGRRYAITDRTWVRGEDDWGIAFNWDTFLSSIAAAWFDPDLAKENLLSGLDTQLPDGRIPLHSRRQNGHKAEPPITAGRSQHIVQAFAAWKVYLHTRDLAWLAECYPKLVRAHRWWFSDRGDGQAWRDGAGRGLLGFGYDPELEMGVLGAAHQPYVSKAQYAYFETYDDSPQWTEGHFFKSIRGKQHLTEADVNDRAKYLQATHTADMYTLERNCLYALDAECLARIAGELGLREDQADFLAEHEAMGRRVNELMWDETAGCYFNLGFDGRLSKIYSPDVFLPMLAGVADEARAQRLMDILLDPNKFWGEYMIPSVAKDDPSFEDQRYWRGQIWPPQTYWVYGGLKRYNRHDTAAEYADRVRRMFLREWEENGFSPENYSGVTGRCSGAPHYNWGTLMGVISLEECVELTPEEIRFGRRGVTADLELRNVPIDGHLYSVRVEGGVTVVERDGLRIGRGTGTVVVPRAAIPYAEPVLGVPKA